MTKPRQTNPTSLYLERSEVIAWLTNKDGGPGFREGTVRQMLESGLIIPLPGKRKRWKFYSRIQIQRDVLDSLNPDEGPASTGQPQKEATAL